MMTEIKGAKEFYPYTPSLLPLEHNVNVLDLGCGTGLELEYYFALNGDALVVEIDLSADMLAVLKRKFANRKIKLICGSYFDVPFGANCFDAAVSVESMHHFTAAQKLKLYKKLNTALTDNGYFVLTDYFAESKEKEQFYFSELERLKSEHEIEVLKKAGFSDVRIMRIPASNPFRAFLAKVIFLPGFSQSMPLLFLRSRSPVAGARFPF